MKTKRQMKNLAENRIKVQTHIDALQLLLLW